MDSNLDNDSLDYTRLVRLPPDSVLVEDPDEEIFLLYTGLRAGGVQDRSTSFTGLGAVDSKADVLTISFDLPLSPPEPPSTVPSNEGSRSPSHRRRKSRTKKPVHTERSTFDIELMQDKTLLRSRKGDTGSVLWRVTRELCKILIQQNCAGCELESSLFDLNLLNKCHILELGSGTGLLALLLSHWSRHFTATDQDYLVPLIRKNIAHNIASVSGALAHYMPDIGLENKPSERLTVESLDWLDIYNAPHSSRIRIFPPELPGVGAADVIFAVDCVYNPSLIPPLVTVLNHYTVPDRTRVIVAVELRSDDVLREFLELWVASGNSSSDNSGKWVIHRVCGDAWMDPCFAVWMGWKSGIELHAEVDSM